jgi:hypothetical protein
MSWKRLARPESITVVKLVTTDPFDSDLHQAL